MSFFSFNENFYRRKLEYYENRSLSNADIYEAKQFVKEQSFAEMKVFMRQKT